jgi:hypothetical protein
MAFFWKKGNTPEANAKKGFQRENHPGWVSDRSKLKFRPRPEGAEWRNAVFQRDNYVCQECGNRGGRLNAHHKAPYKLFPELRFETENGITLCDPCHKEIHTVAAELFGGLNKKGAHFAFAI